MKQIGEVLPVIGADPGCEVTEPERRVARLVLRGTEVVLPAIGVALPSLPAALARRARSEVRPADPNAGVEREAVGGEVLVTYRPALMPPTPASEQEKRAAWEPAQRLRRMLEPRADPRLIEAWLFRWVDGVPAAPEGEKWQRKAQAFVLGLADMPAVAFTVESAVLVMQRAKFFPSVAELRAVLDEVLRPHRDMLAGLEAILAAPAPQPPAREARPGSASPIRARDEAEVEGVRAKAAAHAAEVEARAAAQRAAVQARSRTLRDDELVALYRQQIAQAQTLTPGGAGALQFRLDALLRRMGEAS